MCFDTVHDCQSAYRKLLRAFSYPGSIESLSDEASKIDVALPCHPAITVIALTLLDGEASFGWLASEEGGAEAIRGLSGAIAAAPEKADFVFCDSRNLLSAIAAARPGDLVDPHKGSTVVAMAERLMPDGRLVCKGPGVLDSKRFGTRFSECSDSAWVNARCAKNAEFPMGVDLIIVDPDSRILCLPRTTRVLLEA